MARSDLEQQFALMWVTLYPEIDLISEFRFAPPRRFRFDFAAPDRKIAIEIQGGIWVDGRHSRGSGLIKEHEKLNLAASIGWRIFFLSSATIEDTEVYDLIARSIGDLTRSG